MWRWNWVSVGTEVGRAEMFTLSHTTSAAGAETSAKAWISGRESQKSPSCQHQLVSEAQKRFGRGGTREGETLRTSGSLQLMSCPLFSTSTKKFPRGKIREITFGATFLQWNAPKKTPWESECFREVLEPQPWAGAMYLLRINISSFFFQVFFGGPRNHSEEHPGYFLCWSCLSFPPSPCFRRVAMLWKGRILADFIALGGQVKRVRPINTKMPRYLEAAAGMPNPDCFFPWE